jgi:hypothetical protein
VSEPVRRQWEVLVGRVVAACSVHVLVASFLLKPVAVSIRAASAHGYTFSDQVRCGTAVFLVRWSLVALNVWSLRALAGTEARTDRLARWCAGVVIAAVLIRSIWRAWTLLGGP